MRIFAVRLVIVTIWCLAICQSFTIPSKKFCETGQFFDNKVGSCKVCSTTCPKNQIMRRTCSAFRDSICGPFFEFSVTETRGKNFQPSRNKGNRNNQQLLTQDTNPEGFPPVHGPPNQGWIHLTVTNSVQSSDDVHLLSFQETSESENLFDKHRGVAAFIASTVAVITIFIIFLITFFIRRKLLEPVASHEQITDVGVDRSGESTVIRIPPVHLVCSPRVVDRRVFHIELQLHQNSLRRARLGNLFQNVSRFGGNEYVDEKLRKLLISNSNGND